MNNKTDRSDSLSRSFMRYYIASLISLILLMGFITGIDLWLQSVYFTKIIGTATHELNQYADQQLRQLGEHIIQTKARDTAKQVEIYLRFHPDISMQELQNNAEFGKIAIQPVGKTGYTCLHEAPAGIVVIHPNQAIIGKKMSLLGEKLPSWWAIIRQSMTGNELSGYYDWNEPDGSVRQKYMTFTPVNYEFHGIILMVSATTYIDEFSAPMAEMNAKADEIRVRSRQFVFRQSVIFGIAGVNVFVSAIGLV